MRLLRQIRQIRARLPSAVFRRSKVALRFSRWLLAGRKQIIVLGGHGGDGFDDNSRAMAIHLSSDPVYDVYWVAKDAPRRDVARFRGITQMTRGTLWAEFVTAAAHCMYYSHGLSDVTLAPIEETPWRKIVYLGHGMWGFKRVERRDSCEEPKRFDLTICVSDIERELKADVFGCDERSIVPVGLPKHDALFQTSDKPELVKDRKLVLYAPTWRDWLQHKPSDLAIERHFAALEDLAAQMPRSDHSGSEIEMMYLIHKNIRGLADVAKGICEKYGIQCAVSTDVDVNKLLVDSDFLITDYSALFWDYIIQGKPAARFVFDRDVYDRLTGGYEHIERMTEKFSYEDPRKVWQFLLSNQAKTASTELASTAAPFSIGSSCERLTVAMDFLLRGEPVEASRVPSRAFSLARLSS